MRILVGTGRKLAAAGGFFVVVADLVVIFSKTYFRTHSEASFLWKTIPGADRFMEDNILDVLKSGVKVTFILK